MRADRGEVNKARGPGLFDNVVRERNRRGHLGSNGYYDETISPISSAAGGQK